MKDWHKKSKAGQSTCFFDIEKSCHGWQDWSLKKGQDTKIISNQCHFSYKEEEDNDSVHKDRQEWFESADLEKKAPKTTSENQPEETETVEPVDTDIQASEETDISSKEAETHDEEAPETIEENQTEEQGEAKADQDKTQESSAKVKNLINKALESPYIPEIDPHKTARLKEEISLFWSWLVEAIKSPTSNLETGSTHSYTALLLLILFSASSFFL